MCIRDRFLGRKDKKILPVAYTHFRAHETLTNLVCHLRREKIVCRRLFVAVIILVVSDAVPPFFFKQKTAYGIHERLVGSEMCIRDSYLTGQIINVDGGRTLNPVSYTHLTLPTTPYV